MPTNIRDPRSVVTPDAFGIDEPLLGTPLAGPWRRFWAMMIDLVVIGVLTVITGSVQILVWTVVGAFILRMAFQRSSRAGQAVAVLLRVFAGCLGLTILASVAMIFLFLRGASGGGDLSDMGGRASGAGLSAVGRQALADVEDPDQVVEIATGMLQGAAATGGLGDDPEDFLDDMMPDDVPWEDQSDSLFAVAIARWRGEERAEVSAQGRGDAVSGDSGGAADSALARGPEPQSGTEGAAEASGRGEEAESADRADRIAAAVADVAALDAAGVLAAWGRVLEERDAASAAGEASAEDDPVRVAHEAALRRRVLEIVAADTLERLEVALESARDDARSNEATLGDLREALDERRSGFAELLRDIWDQAGSAIGLWSLYFTVMLTVWKGQTVGKKALRVRVLRLDGQPMGWWSSFERAGGYVAGIATGLLGFAQVFWDPNRQCIHDKIVGTVVVLDGVPPIRGAWLDTHGSDEPRRPPRGEGPT